MEDRGEQDSNWAWAWSQVVQASNSWWVRGLGFYGPIAAGIAFMAFLWSKLPEGVSPLVVTPFGMIFFVCGFLIRFILDEVSRESREGADRKQRSWLRFLALLLGAILVVAFVIALLVMIVLFITGIFWGVPINLRHYISPEFVRREIAPDSFKLNCIWGNEFLRPRYYGANDGFESKIREEMDTLNNWIMKATSNEATIVVVYQSDPVDEYYEPTDATIRFINPDFDAIFGEGIAFIQKGDNLEKLRLVVFDGNMDWQDSELSPSANAIYDFQIDAGECFMIVAVFCSKTDELLPNNPEYFDAELVTRVDAKAASMIDTIKGSYVR